MKKYKGIAAAVAVLIAVLPCAVSPVFANSALRYEEGISGSGVVTRNNDSVLAVESEKLIFDVKEFPELSYDGGSDYKSTVTAEYKFVNTSDKTVHTSMAFPAGNVPSYFRYYTGDIAVMPEKPTITVDGVEIDAQIRHTFGSYMNYSSFKDAVSEITDGWYEGDFYKLDTPVTAYSVSVNTDGYDALRVTGKVTCDRNKARYLSPNYSGNDEMVLYFYDDSSSGNPLEYTYYVLGDSSVFSCQWKVEEQHFNRRFGPWYTQVDVPVEVKQVKDKDGTPFVTTLKELVLSKRKSGSLISEQDYYNGIAMNCLRDNEGISFGGYASSLNTDDDNFCIWYTYDVEVEPNGSFVNAVTAPLYPSIDMGYSPYVYEYEYYLSPAKGWADFKNLDIEIKSDAYILSSSLAVNEADGAYKASFSTLPDGELTFRLCSVAEPESHSGGVALSTLFIILAVFGGVFLVIPAIAGITVAIVFAVKNKKKSQ